MRATYCYQGSSYCVGPAADIEGTPSERAKEISRIRLLYDAGTPFFTKEAIRNASQELKKASEDGAKEISVRGMDGVVINFSVVTGKVLRSWKESETETEKIV